MENINNWYPIIDINKPIVDDIDIWDSIIDINKVGKIDLPPCFGCVVFDPQKTIHLIPPTIEM